jgi:cyanophycinase
MMMFPKKNKGHLVLIGGAEDKTHKKVILRHALKINEAKNVAIIPTASSYPKDLILKYRNAFYELGARNIFPIDIRRRKEADTSQYMEFIEQADLIFFTGGDQDRLVQILAGTSLLQQILRKHQRGATIAGTSAGASALGNPMILEGNGNKGFKKKFVVSKQGFGCLDKVVIDTHFLERCRIPRLAQTLSAGGASIGLGLSEDTGAVISPSGQCEVIGSRVITILDNSKMNYTNYQKIGAAEQVVVDGLKLSFLSHGMQYDLKRKKLLLN